jgi:hypothetical protein
MNNNKFFAVAMLAVSFNALAVEATEAPIEVAAVVAVENPLEEVAKSKDTDKVVAPIEDAAEEADSESSEDDDTTTPSPVTPVVPVPVVVAAE